MKFITVQAKMDTGEIKDILLNTVHILCFGEYEDEPGGVQVRFNNFDIPYLEVVNTLDEIKELCNE